MISPYIDKYFDVKHVMHGRNAEQENNDSTICVDYIIYK